MIRASGGAWLCALLAGVAGWGAQSEGNANARYRTAEGRAALARGLSRPDRDAQQKPLELVAAMKLAAGMTVADVGTGTGYMLPFLSRAVGASGRVLAEDVFPDFLEQARQHAAGARLENVTLVLGTDRDPKLPAAGLDLALVLDTYHHFDHPAEMLAGIRAALKPGGRLVVVDYYRSKEALNGDALEHIRADRAEVIEEVQAAGFRLVESHPHVPREQYMATFEKWPGL